MIDNIISFTLSNKFNHPKSGKEEYIQFFKLMSKFEESRERRGAVLPPHQLLSCICYVKCGEFTQAVLLNAILAIIFYYRGSCLSGLDIVFWKQGSFTNEHC